MKRKITNKILGTALVFLTVGAAFRSVALVIYSLNDGSLLQSIVNIKGEQAYAEAEEETIILPPIELPEKGPPKLDSQLHQLTLAEARGKAVSFSQQRNITLVEERVRVIIECLPGQVEMATEALATHGIVELKTRRGLIQALVPIMNLIALAEAEGIRFIRLPVYAEDA